MTFFESLLALLLAAVLLLQVARRLRLPYPAMLALAGVAVAFVPGAPAIRLDSENGAGGRCSSRPCCSTPPMIARSRPPGRDGGRWWCRG